VLVASLSRSYSNNLKPAGAVAKQRKLSDLASAKRLPATQHKKNWLRLSDIPA